MQALIPIDGYMSILHLHDRNYQQGVNPNQSGFSTPIILFRNLFGGPVFVDTVSTYYILFVETVCAVVRAASQGDFGLVATPRYARYMPRFGRC